MLEKSTSNGYRTLVDGGFQIFGEKKMFLGWSLVYMYMVGLKLQHLLLMCERCSKWNSIISFRPRHAIIAAITIPSVFDISPHISLHLQPPQKKNLFPPQKKISLQTFQFVRWRDESRMEICLGWNLSASEQRGGLQRQTSVTEINLSDGCRVLPSGKLLHNDGDGVMLR